jgi:RHS repeat-associated protein
VRNARQGAHSANGAKIGLDYFGARYFSGAQGRFTSPDAPFADQHADDPQSWILYAYVGNNPLKYVDPTGQGEIGRNWGPITLFQHYDGPNVSSRVDTTYDGLGRVWKTTNPVKNEDSN